MGKENFECRICGNNSCKSYHIREMMFGTNDQFLYWECENCGCLQIDRYIENIEKYYPENYYSFKSDDLNSYQTNGFLEYIKIKILIYNRLVFNNTLKYIFTRLRSSNYQFLNLSMRIKAKPYSKILDVGCGNGQFLYELYKLGFSKLKGVDKYIPESFTLFKKIEVLKKDLTEINDKFNIITMHHSFEHMQSQLEVLKNAYKLLYSNGVLILRIPIKNEAWKIYKENWVQIDAPRHYYIHTVESIKLLAENAGFRIETIEFDSTSFQFWGSEQYRQNIPLRGDKRSYAETKSEKLFSAQQIADWENESKELNRLGKGDQAIIILRKINE